MTEVEKETGMTDAECEYWDEYYTKNTFELGPNLLKQGIKPGFAHKVLERDFPPLLFAPQCQQVKAKLYFQFLTQTMPARAGFGGRIVPSVRGRKGREEVRKLLFAGLSLNKMNLDSKTLILHTTTLRPPRLCAFA